MEAPDLPRSQLEPDGLRERVIGWGWYYLSTAMDGFSCFIIGYELGPTNGDNGPAYVSKDLQNYLQEQGMTHTRGRPCHPQAQGKIERYRRSMKNVLKLRHYYFPWELEAAVGDIVAYYNHRRCRESLDNCTPADVHYGQHLSARAQGLCSEVLRPEVVR